jgi:predicted nucleic acid-binding protein
MILVDTNIVSEFMTSAPATPVLNWLNAQTTASLYLSTITVAEIHYGLRLLPAGKRRNFLRERFDSFVTLLFTGRVLAFDQEAAALYGEIAVARRISGRPISTLDAQIAATARSRTLVLATRNTKDFAACGVELIDPFAFVG